VRDLVNAEPCYRCGACSRQVIHDARDYCVRECPFCGAMDRAKPRPMAERATAPVEAARASEQYRFQHGRFAGKTLSEVHSEETGRRYLQFMRRDPRFRDVIEAFLFSVAGSTSS